MFDFESLKTDLANPNTLLWVGLALMVIAVIYFGYYWMNSKQEQSYNKQSSVSFAPTTQEMELPNDQQAQQELENQPTVATCVVNDAGEQVCAY